MKYKVQFTMTFEVEVDEEDDYWAEVEANEKVANMSWDEIGEAVDGTGSIEVSNVEGIE